MALVIPAGNSNWITSIFNTTGGGSSSKSTIAIGLDNAGGLDAVIVARVANLIRDGLKLGWDSGWTFGPIHVLENVAGTLRFWDDTVQEAGTATAAVYSPPAVSIVVTKNTGVAGRSMRGRWYLPGVVEAEVDEAGLLASGYVTAFQTLVNNLQTALIADAAIDNMVLFHDANSPEAGQATVINQLVVRNVVGNMRPRQRR